MSFLSKIASLFSNLNDKEIKKIQPLIDKINRLEKRYQSFSDEKIKGKTQEFKGRLNKGETLDQILPHAFAACREAAKRTISQRAFDTQLIGGVALHQGKIAEMKTGEGKTLAASFAAYLNALEGKGVHIITVNDYLARRDTNWMGAIYYFLGLSTGCVQHDTSYIYDPKIKPDQDEVSVEYQNLTQVPRSEAYKADITFGTNNEFGFDYLRDNMVSRLAQMVQVRDPKALAKEELKKKKRAGSLSEKELLKKSYLNFAIVDEVDSILIDESRTPLIISSPDVESARLYQKCAQIVPRLAADKDYNIDEKMQAVTLTESGISKLEKLLSLDNLYTSGNMRYVHHVHQALKAHAIFKRDKQYVVKDNEVIIVDDFTGRLMPGRRFSEGLHQALEAKEGVAVQKESRTLATITFQNYFRLYKKLSGMTGTALTSAEEFSKVYELDVLSIPTNKQMIRQDKPDLVYKNEHGKLKAIAQEIKRRNKKGQPVLIGTISVEKSEVISKYLDQQGVTYEILNAKNHEREAQIIAQAGQKKAVTIATNMAGRGTDIKLGKGVVARGGLHIVGTERHEARRIDNQLRGRAGRQGDPGSSQFYVSLEDELMRRFGSDKIKSMMDTLGLPEDQPIANKMISRSIESAQKKIEGYNFDIRKHVLEYDDVINRQREVIYQKRRQNLLGILDRKEIEQMIKKLAADFVTFHTQAEDQAKWNLKEIYEYAASLFLAPESFLNELEKTRQETNLGQEEKVKKIIDQVSRLAISAYKQKEKAIGQNSMRHVEQVIMLRTIDAHWMDHLDHIQYLREGIGLRGYGQRDPLIEYKKESFDMFQELLQNIRLNTIETLFKIKIEKRKPEGKEQTGEKKQPNIKGPGSLMEFIRQARDELISKNLNYQGADNSKSLLAQARDTDGETQAKASPSSSEEKTQTPIINREKIGRNQPCPCGSGKKYKKCCGKK
ncbi:MAG: SEC-C metal-binding domain-containing protein [Patescibacteria group bacterium]|nr:SEC-C domain-containing protein [Patescibacteria group bacterium]